jgi:hypothetical protein
VGILSAFFIALVVALFFARGKRASGSIAALAIFFLILFLAGIAGNYWIVPFGPQLWGVSWLPILFIVIIVTLLLESPSPNRRRTMNPDIETSPFEAVSLLMWILFLFLIIAIIAGLLRSPKV